MRIFVWVLVMTTAACASDSTAIVAQHDATSDRDAAAAVDAGGACQGVTPCPSAGTFSYQACRCVLRSLGDAGAEEAGADAALDASHEPALNHAVWSADDQGFTLTIRAGFVQPASCGNKYWTYTYTSLGQLALTACDRSAGMVERSVMLTVDQQATLLSILNALRSGPKREIADVGSVSLTVLSVSGAERSYPSGIDADAALLTDSIEDWTPLEHALDTMLNFTPS